MNPKLSKDTVARLMEMMERLNTNGPRKTLDEVLEWAVLRQYNRQRAVKRHSLSLKDVELEVSPLEERDAPRGRDDE
jgi:hypothetical protein